MSGHTSTDRELQTEAPTNLSQQQLQHEDQDAADGSFLDISPIPHTGPGTGKGRLDSLRENLSKQQERLTALRDRAHRKTEDGGRRKTSISDSVESLKSLGQKLTVLKTRNSAAAPTPVATPDATPHATPQFLATPAENVIEIKGSEKLQMLNQRTEQTRALLEQRRRDMAKSLMSVKTGLRHSASSELGSSMSDLHAMAVQQSGSMSRHRSAADLQPQQQQDQDEARLKLLKNKMKLIELKQSRKEQELLELRNELNRREEHIQQLEREQLEREQRELEQREVEQLKREQLEREQRELEQLKREQLTLEQLEQEPQKLDPLAEQEHARMHAEIEQLKERNAELEANSDILEATRLELHNAREELLEQQQQTSRSTDVQVNAELAKQLQDLENQLEQVRSSNNVEKEANQLSETERLSELETTIKMQCSQLAAQSEQLAEKTTELNVLNVNLRLLEEKLTQSVKSKPIFLDEPMDADVASELQQQLKQKLDECNKSNIKLKLKCKQAEKQLQKFQSQDAQQQLAKLSAENEQLQQRIIVLEDEKGSWQLAHVEEEEDQPHRSSTTQKETQTETIRLLEEQKEELQQALEALQLGSESARVESELSEVQLEEQLSQRVQQLETEASEQRLKLQTLQAEKESLDKKLSHYVNENMELLDKLEKLSSSSSAESIEIVESPQFSQHGGEDSAVPAALPSFVSELTQTDLAASELEVNESLAQLRNKSDEQLQKIALFTNERREVLAKMEQLQAENARLQAQLQLQAEQVLTLQSEQTALQAAQQSEQAALQAEQLSEQAALQSQLQADNTTLQAQLKHAQEQLHAEQAALQTQLEELQRDKQHLTLQLSEKSNLSQELSSMQRSSEVVAALDCGEAGGAALFDKCERSLCKLSSELDAYRKANNNNAKLNVSKKLAKEAKNVHIQLTELLHKVKEASTAVETVTVVETVVAVTAPNGKALAEYEQLTAQNAELKSALALLQAEINELRDSYEPAELLKLAIGGQEEQQEREEVQAERAQQRREWAQLQEERAQQQTEREQQQKEREEQQKEREEQQNEREEQQEEREELQKEREELQKEREEQQMEREKLQKERKQQQKERQQLLTEREQLQQERTQKQEQQYAKLEQLQTQRDQLQEQQLQLQFTISELRAGETEHLQLIGSQSAELIQLQLQAEQYDNNLNSSEMAHEKHMEQQQRLRRELESRVETLEGELSILQALAAEQKQQLIESYSESEHETNLKLLELQQCRQELETSESRNKELRDKLKKYALNLKKHRTEQAELEQQLRKAQEVGKEQLELEQLLRAEQATVETLRQELQQQQLQRSQEQKTLEQLQQQCLKQQKKLSSLTFTKEDVERLQVELQNTVHANTALREDNYQLEQSLAAVKNNHNTDELRQQLEQRALKLNKSKEVIKQRNASIQSLQRELNELKEKRQVYPEEYEEEREHLFAEIQAARREKINFEQTISRLEALHEGIQAKLQQDQTYIESLETQKDELETKSAMLEDQLAKLQAEQSLAMEQVQLLGHQLHERSAQQAAHEAQMVDQLQQLQQREQTQARQLQQLNSEADETKEQLATLQATHESLLVRHKQQTQQAEQALAERAQLSSNSEQELQDLRVELQQRQQELQRQRNVSDAKLAAKATELDELECEFSAQMERASLDARELSQSLERTQVQLQRSNDELERLHEKLNDVERERATLSREATLLRLQHDSSEQDVLELQELRMQALQDKTEMDNLRTQIDALCANHSQELQALQQQLAELDTLGQNQTDDQVYIETENKRLAEQLLELQARLEDAQQYQQQHQAAQAGELPSLWLPRSESQEQLAANQGWMYSAPDNAAWLRNNPYERTLEPYPVPRVQNVPIPAPAMFFGNDAASAPSPFDEIVPQPLRIENGLCAGVAAVGAATIEDLQRNVSDLEKHAKELETKLLSRNQALAEHEERRLQLERQLAEREQELAKREQELQQLRVAAEEKERLAAIEKLIQTEQVAATAAPTTLDMFFGGESVTDAGLSSLELGQMQQEPVVEELIRPKKAYLCQPEKEQEQEWGVDIDEDPWASAAAAAVEQPAADTALHAKIEQLERQKAEQQTKIAKLMKRIKEYRSKEQQQQLEQSKNANQNNNDLDDAMIEELRHQLQLQESKQYKTEELVQQHALEKEKLTKRIDVLSAANERMLELKERQDMDVQMYQTRIRELLAQLQQLESWGDEGAAAAAAKTEQEAASHSNDTAKLESLQAENLDLNNECQELQAQLQRERKALILVEQQKADNEAEQEIVQQQLQLQLAELRSKMELTTAAAKPSDETIAQLHEREAEIVHLKQRIEDLMREDQTEKLVFEILTKNQELQVLRTQVKQLEEHQMELEQKQQKEQEHQKEQEQQMKQEQQKEQPETAAELELMQLRQRFQQLELEKNDMEEELRVLNNHVLASLELEDQMKLSVLQLDTKNIEITELRQTVELMKQQLLQAQQEHHEQQEATPAAAQPDLSQINQQWEALVEQKCSEVASVWQKHLEQREAAYEAHIEQLKAANPPPANPAPAESLTEPLIDASTKDMLNNMQKALETQEMEIVTLKEQLAIRSAEYARLASQYDPFRLQNTLGAGTGGAMGAGAATSGGATQEPLPDYVPKSDLDYALMMLHQRDMRVEEMIQELVQLLEERDHLQLKLSDTLRQLETERSRSNNESPPAVSSAASGSTNSISSDLAAASGSDLKQKLAELQTAKHSKDKAIVDEREQRQQQMIQLQRDMAKTATATTTAAAAATTTATTTTMTTIAPSAGVAPSQQLDVDSQQSLRSPSMVLMDWILGNNNKSEDDAHHSHNPSSN